MHSVSLSRRFSFRSHLTEMLRRRCRSNSPEVGFAGSFLTPGACADWAGPLADRQDDGVRDRVSRGCAKGSVRIRIRSGSAGVRGRAAGGRDGLVTRPPQAAGHLERDRLERDSTGGGFVCDRQGAERGRAHCAPRWPRCASPKNSKWCTKLHATKTLMKPAKRPSASLQHAVERRSCSSPGQCSSGSDSLVVGILARICLRTNRSDVVRAHGQESQHKSRF